ncbi:MAG: class I SAM-dependent methyltransferase [Cyclobacteriaceae bacterium]
MSESYISHTGGEKKITDQIYLLARKFALKKKRKLVLSKSNGKSILDFGCGTGEFLNEMRSNEWSISGIELSDLARAKAEQLNQKKIYPNLSEIGNEKFDVITLWHVLEHLHDLNDTLDKLKKLMKDTSTLIIAVPNHESHDAIHYQSFWAGYDVPRHLWHFSKKSMDELLKKNGFKLTEVLPMKLDSFYVSLLSEKYKYPKKSTITRLFSAFITGLVSNLKAKKSTNFSSLIYIAKS